MKTNKKKNEIVFPALVLKLATNGLTFGSFCQLAALNEKRFAKAMTGKREFVLWEIVNIRTALSLTDDEVLDIFFPELVGRKYDQNGYLIKSDAVAQI